MTREATTARLPIAKEKKAEVIMNWSGYWPIIPFTVLWGISEFVESSALYWGLNTAGLIIWFWLTNQFVPLVVKSKPATTTTPT